MYMYSICVYMYLIGAYDGIDCTASGVDDVHVK